MAEPHRIPIQLRFSDSDAMGHLNNASYAHYAELARITFFRELGVEVGNLILARLAFDFHRQVLIDDTVEVITEVEGVGNSSIRLRQQVLIEAGIAAEASSVMVYFDYRTNRPKPVPPALREQLEAFILAVQ